MPETVVRALDGQVALVTGATGFIGGRLVERLLLEQRASVRALVREYGRAARLARFDIAMPKGSIENAEAVDRAIAGSDVVFNLAYVTSNSVEENVLAIDHVIEACLRHGVQRLVHVSTFSVHEPFTDEEISADSPYGDGSNPYAAAKIAVERRILDAVHQRGLPAVIIRPSIVYGPFGGHWTDRVTRSLLKGKVVLPNDGGGLCNGVFVDDLVDAMILAATMPNVLGECFLISGPEPVTWKAFYQSFQECLGIETLEFKDVGSDRGSASYGAPASVTPAPKKRSKGVRRRLRAALGEPVKQPLRRMYRRYRKLVPAPRVVSTDYDYMARPICRMTKERELLGYEPRFDFASGMAVTCEYLTWAYPRDR